MEKGFDEFKETSADALTQEELDLKVFNPYLIDTENKELRDILDQEYSESISEEFGDFVVEIPLMPYDPRWANLDDKHGKNEFHISVKNSGKNEILLSVAEKLRIPIGSIGIETRCGYDKNETTSATFDKPFVHNVAVKKTPNDIGKEKVVGSEYYKGSIIMDLHQLINCMNPFSCINMPMTITKKGLVSHWDTEKVLRRMIASSLEVGHEDVLVKNLYPTHGLAAYDIYHKKSVDNKKEVLPSQKIYRGSIGVYESDGFLYAYNINNTHLKNEEICVGSKLTESLEYNIRVGIANSLTDTPNQELIDSIKLYKFGDNLFDIYY